MKYSGTVIYRHRQMAREMLFAIALVLLLVLTLTTGEYHWGWFLFTIGLLVGFALLFGSLTVVIDTEILLCYFGVGLFRKQFQLAEITAAETVRNRWYYGWGIRPTPTGWMFNVSGLYAVELTLSDGRRFRIGSDQPQVLEQVIRQSIGRT